MILRWLAPVTVILLTYGAVFTHGAVTPLQERHAADAPLDIDAFVKSEQQQLKLPGLAVVVVRSDGQPKVYVSGERRIGKGDPITPADRMHLGSLTKAITATLIGALVEKQKMTFETTIGQAFPELSSKILPAYQNVTVRQLLGHAGGIQPYRDKPTLMSMLTLKGTPIEQRIAMMERTLAEPPRFEPGTRHEYSNAGPSIAGAMAERLGGGAPYEQLVEQLVFAPLGGHAAFGNPGLAAEPQPWGHSRAIFGSVAEVIPAAPAFTTPLAFEPAGDASPSMYDYGRFLQLHLRGLKGRDDILKAATIQELHTRVAPSTANAAGNLMGWSLMPRDGVESHEHTGSYGAFTAYVTVQPSRDIAVAAVTNLGNSQELRDACGRVALRIARGILAPTLTKDQ